MEILFWRHQTSSQKKIGQCTIYCRVTVDGEREEIGSTNVKTNVDWFNTKTGKVEPDDPFYLEKNTRLNEEYERTILKVYNDLTLNKKPVSALIIKARFASTGKELKIMELFDRYLAYYKELTEKPEPKIKKNKIKKKEEPRRSESTLRPLTTCRNKMLDYVIDKHLQRVFVDDLPESFLNDYEDWLWSIGHAQSTVVKHLRTFKQITKWGFSDAKIISFDPCANTKVDGEDETDPIFLTAKQFEYWKSHKFMNKSAQEVADVFTVYCRTGLSYIDLKQVITNPSEYLRSGLDGKMWLYKPREKTNETSKVPISSFKDLEPIIQKYGGWGRLPIKSNETMNDWLKICVAEINLHLPEDVEKIYEGLSVKHARCTLSDWWINELGNKEESLIPILGRKTTEGLRRYVRPDERAVIAALKSVKQ